MEVGCGGMVWKDGVGGEFGGRGWREGVEVHSERLILIWSVM